MLSLIRFFCLQNSLLVSICIIVPHFREASECLIIVGPEGDFTPEELIRLIKEGARPVGLGSNRLRTETAGIAALSAAQLCFLDVVE
jgi:16S rRNA (uracil1498-N3)-methyltransferase